MVNKHIHEDFFLKILNNLRRGTGNVRRKESSSHTSSNTFNESSLILKTYFYPISISLKDKVQIFILNFKG